MQHFLQGYKIRAIAAAYPRQTEDLHSLGDTFGREEVERIIASTGIHTVRKAVPGVCASDLCQAAAEQLLSELSLDRSSIDGLLFLSQTPDWPLPSTACALQHRLGLSRETLAMDILCGCTAYIYGLFQGALLVQSGACRKVLVCTGDVISPLVNPGDKATRMVFGDAAGVTLVEKDDDRNDSRPFIIQVDGSGGDHLMVEAGGGRRPHSMATAEAKECESGNRRAPDNIYMNGMEILNFSLREVPPAIRQTISLLGWSENETAEGAVILHQANQFMVDYLRRKMRLPQEAVPLAVAEVGNTGPASIPLTLCLTHEQLRRQGRLNKTLMCGFGAGLSWGTAAEDLADTAILDPVVYDG